VVYKRLCVCVWGVLECMLQVTGCRC